MSRILTFLTGRNLPTIWQSGKDAASIINEKTIRDFTRVVEQTRILERERAARQSQDIKAETERLDRFFEDR
jgi:hypothetical protein